MEPSTSTSCSESEGQEDSHKYPPTWEAVLLTIGLFVSLFCTCLDATILATAMPHITDQFHSLNDIGWYSSSYLAAMAATKMLWGKLYTFYPSKWVFLAGLIIFEIGSLICGVAPSSLALILGRCIAGLGSSSIDSGAIIILTSIVPLPKRPIYMSVLGSVRGIAAGAGPPLGGLLTDKVSWRWCFYINLPFGFVTAICLFFLLSRKTRPPETTLSAKEKFKKFDPVGLCLFVPGVVTLLLALQWGGSSYPWDSWRVILLFTLSGTLLIVFCIVQVWMKEDALLPVRVMKNRNMIAALWYVSMSTAALYVFIYYLPVWFQAIKRSSATQSGVMLLPTEVGIVVFAVIGGLLVTKVGYYTPFLIFSSICTSTGAGLLSTLQPSSGTGKWLGCQVLLSAGAGLGAQNALLVPQVAIPPGDIVVGITVFTFVQILAGSVALAIGESIFNSRLMSNLQAATSSLKHPLKPTGVNISWDQVPPNLVGAVLSAYNRSICQTFYLGVAMFSLSFLGTIALEWKSIKSDSRQEKDQLPVGETSEDLADAPEMTKRNDS